ncbi:Hypothetical predicted protein [Cloeon dipterum]|uniref:Secreted protein n=1 Tax=Cloeon dipterum TaxID=197152 RepID=A0A8S1D9K3_9INSE|nr:Hypothetical predicted protein [Cloeon dipterum]
MIYKPDKTFHWSILLFSFRILVAGTREECLPPPDGDNFYPELTYQPSVKQLRVNARKASEIRCISHFLR